MAGFLTVGCGSSGGIVGDDPTVYRDADSFAFLTPAWTKAAANPLTGAGYGDPCLWFEGGTYYIFANDAAGAIWAWVTADLDNWGSPSVALGMGASGSWDYRRRDAGLCKIGSTYYLYYSGQTDASPSATTHKVGYATATAITGPWTPYASNPVISRAGEGVNEPTPVYDADLSPPLRVYCTAGATGTADDVGPADICLFTAATPDGAYTDAGDVLAGNYQDQGVFPPQTQSRLWLMLVNDANGDAPLTRSADGVTWTAPSVPDGFASDTSGAWDDFAVYAPDAAWDGSRWVAVYQGSDGTDHRLGYATSPTLTRWLPGVRGVGPWSVAGGELVFGGGDNTEWCTLYRTRGLYALPYTVETRITATAQASTGVFQIAFLVGQSASKWYWIGVRVDDPTINLLECDDLDLTVSNVVLQMYTGSPLVVGTPYRLRATVTAAGISVDFHDGSAWVAGILTASKTMATGYCGYGGYGTGNTFTAGEYTVT